MATITYPKGPFYFVRMYLSTYMERHQFTCDRLTKKFAVVRDDCDGRKIISLHHTLDEARQEAVKKRHGPTDCVYLATKL